MPQSSGAIKSQIRTPEIEANPEHHLATFFGGLLKEKQKEKATGTVTVEITFKNGYPDLLRTIDENRRKFKPQERLRAA